MTVVVLECIATALSGSSVGLFLLSLFLHSNVGRQYRDDRYAAAGSAKDPTTMTESLKHKFIREIYADRGVRSLHLAAFGSCFLPEYAEVHPQTGLELYLECLPRDPESPDPWLRCPPKEMPKDLQFFGLPLRANEDVPLGEMRIT